MAMTGGIQACDRRLASLFSPNNNRQNDLPGKSMSSATIADARPALQTEFVLRLSVDVAAPVSVGETGLGVRRQIAISGGELRGPNMRGKILPEGAERPMSPRCRPIFS
jgi:Protein of unknown function (DUF3237)